MENKKWIGLRGLARGNGHWGNFPEVLKSFDPNIDFEMLEIPGNGTLNNNRTPLIAEEVLTLLKQNSRIANENKSFNLIGISLGGMLGLKWAEQFPLEIEKLIVINSSLSQFSPFHKRLQPDQILHLTQALYEKNTAKRELIILKIVSNFVEKNKSNLKKNIEFSTNYPTTTSNLLRQLILAKFLTIDKTKLNTQIKLLCSSNDKLVHYSCSKKIAEQFSLPIQFHTSAGHDLLLDAPEWVAKQMINF
jgi:pimeloyl-ACP methyl ester carboxylesterase